MKAISVLLLLCLPSLAWSSDRSEPARGMLSVTGYIESGCNVYLNTQHPMARAMESLRYNLPAPQIVAEVVLTCNQNDGMVNVTYESVNGGLMNSHGRILEYEKSLSGIRGTSLASSGPWTVSQRVSPRNLFLRVRPLADGTVQGPYSDVILVSIASN